MSRKYPIAFNKEIGDYLKTFGDHEFDLDDPIPGVVEIIKRHGVDDAILEDQARAICDKRYKGDEGPGLFDLERTVALGDRGRIKRRGMERQHIARRKVTIDRNQIAQNRAWAEETEWLADVLGQLEGKPDGTTVGDL